MSDEMEGDLLYNDPFVFAVFPDKPAAKGHIRIYPKKAVKSLDELTKDETQHLFQIANLAAMTLFDVVKAEGTNIILNEGSMFDKLSIDIIARKSKDNLDFRWNPKEGQNVDDVMKRLKDKTDLIGSHAPQEIIKKEEKEIYTKDTDNHMVKHLEKLP